MLKGKDGLTLPEQSKLLGKAWNKGDIAKDKIKKVDEEHAKGLKIFEDRMEEHNEKGYYTLDNDTKSTDPINIYGPGDLFYPKKPL